MSSLLLLLLACLVGVAHSCSCARRRYNAEVCDDRVKYIIKVKIEQDLDDKESFDDTDQVRNFKSISIEISGSFDNNPRPRLCISWH